MTSGSWNVIAKHFVPKIDARPDVTVGWEKKLRECSCWGLEDVSPHLSLLGDAWYLGVLNMRENKPKLGSDCRVLVRETHVKPSGFGR